MTKVEYILAKYYCHLQCEPEDNKCKKCIYLKMLRDKYGDDKL